MKTFSEHIQNAMLFLTRKWGIALHNRSRYGDLLEILRKRYDAAITLGNIEYAMNSIDAGESIHVKAKEYNCKGFLIVQVHQYDTPETIHDLKAEGGRAIPLFAISSLNKMNQSHISYLDLNKYVEGDFEIPKTDSVGQVVVWFCPVYIDESQRHSVNIDY